MGALKSVQTDKFYMKFFSDSSKFESVTEILSVISIKVFSFKQTL